MLKERYKKSKATLLNDKSICPKNRKLFKEFLEKKEYKLKRINGLTKLDDSTYKTLSAYTSRLRTVNRWFKNKAWKDLTEKDIKKIYDDLEDGKIKSRFGQPIKDKLSYYKLIIRSTPFEMAGKKELVKKVMEFGTFKRQDEVRFIYEKDFRKIVEVALKPSHRLLLWLCFDIGENSISILQLTKKDFRRDTDEYTKEPEYRVNLRKETLKRSRTPRSEPTNYQDTVKLLDIHLQDLKDNDNLFHFGHRQAEKILDRCVKIAGIKCIPSGQKVTLKDLRSSMACDCLIKGYSLDEVNARLGHKPSSREIDKYINFLALDKRKPKKKVYESNINKLKGEIEELRSALKLNQIKTASRETEYSQMFSNLRKGIESLKRARRIKPISPKLS
jgi:integrase